MEGKSSRKRPLLEDDDSSKPPMQKRPRFPKGKKVKEVKEEYVAVSGPAVNPKEAAIERRTRRDLTETDSIEVDIKETAIKAAEVKYKDNANFVEDGIQIEPFNLDQEREEGFFDDDGNFVEFANDNKIKDAWLDSVDVDTKFADKRFNVVKDEEEAKELTSDDIGKMKRRIANLLEPGETVLQALRRLKGTSNGKKEKMPEETKLKFDQLTEDSMKLMDNGDYDVYHEKRESFEREAEGYERLARAREGTSGGVEDIFSSGAGPAVASMPLTDGVPASGNDDDSFDMFAEDDEKPTTNPSSDGSGLISGSTAGGTDYVYDESSGYYYSSSLGYYYDPTSQLYCSASSGKWYAFNEPAGTYDEVQGEAGTYEEVQGEGASATPVDS